MKPLGQLCLIEAFVRVKNLNKQMAVFYLIQKYVIELIKLIGVKIIQFGKYSYGC